MSKYNRHQSVISRNTDEHISEDHWLKQFEKNLQKGAVQPKSQSVYEQINSIMNGTSSKYPSVQAAVDNMMERSGLTDYLKVSADKETAKTKTASDQNADFDKTIPMGEHKQQDTSTPDVMLENPAILKTLENYIRSTRGNLPVPAVIDKLHSIHRNDVPKDKMWEDDKLIRLVSKLNLEAKKNNPASYEDYNNLAAGDRDNAGSDVDPSNTDAFNALVPAKISSAASEYHDAGFRDGKEDLENHGFGSDILASLLARLPQHAIPKNQDAWREYGQGYAAGSKMSPIIKDKEMERLIRHFGKVERDM